MVVSSSTLMAEEKEEEKSCSNRTVKEGCEVDGNGP